MGLDRSGIPPRGVLAARKAAADAVRRTFDGAGFLEVDTPIAVPSPGLEPHLLAFETRAVGPDRSVETLYLHTSPEYAMKRLLGAGAGDIFQLARVFRNGERSSTHAPEFTMLEWYRCPGGLDAIAADVEAVVHAVAAAVRGPWRPARTVRLSVSEAFLAAGLPDPFQHGDAASFRAALPVHSRENDGWEDLFFRALLERVEPSFDRDAITILEGYPASMAALARLDPSDPRRALRFEVYLGALEIGNAFAELTDPIEQRARFEEDLRVRAAIGAPAYPIDEPLLEALPRIGDAAGIAVGFDRLLMKCLGAQALQDVIPFSPRDRAREGS